MAGFFSLVLEYEYHKPKSNPTDYGNTDYKHGQSLLTSYLPTIFISICNGPEIEDNSL